MYDNKKMKLEKQNLYIFVFIKEGGKLNYIL